MKIQIRNVEVQQKISKNTGKPYFIQMGRVELNDEIRNVQIFVNGLQEGYPEGLYMLSDESFRVNQYGSLEIGFIKLVKLQAASKAA